MKEDKQDRLGQLFHEVKLENPSKDFMQNLMFRVEKEAIAQKRKKQFLIYSSIVMGIAGIIGISSLIFALYGVDIPESEGHLGFSSLFSSLINMFHGLHINPSIVMVAIIILFLLMGDGIIRKFIQEKQHPDHA